MSRYARARRFRRDHAGLEALLLVTENQPQWCLYYSARTSVQRAGRVILEVGWAGRRNKRWQLGGQRL